LIVLAGLIVYANSFSGEFVWDDVDSIPNNPTLREWSSFSQFLVPHGKGETVTRRPLLNASFALNYALGGLNVWGYHATNLAIHILNGLLLFGIVRRTLQLPPLKARYEGAALGLAWAIAMLWLVHPLQGESVAYIVQRAESLAGLFFLLVLYSVVRARQSSRRVWWYVLAVVNCWLGVATKEIVAIAPLVVLLYDRAFWGGSFREALRRRWGVYLGMVASWVPLAGLVACTYSAKVGRLDLWSYASNQPGVILFYLRLAFWPVGLCHEYSLPMAKTIGGILAPTCLLGLLVAVVLWGLVKGRGWGVVGASFFLALAPSSSIVPLMQLACDRRMYLPLAAVVTLVVLGGFALGQRLTGRFFQRGTLAVGISLVTLAAVVLGTLTFRHNEVYQDNISLWRNIVANGRDPAWACHGFGDILAKQGRFSEAIEYYERAVRLKPDYASAHNNLGVVLLNRGRLQEAVEHFEEALRLQPRYADAHDNWAAALLSMGRAEDAIAHCEAALRLNPACANAHYSWGNALLNLGRFAEAVEHYKMALEIQPTFATVHDNWGSALLRQGNFTEAIEHFKLAANSDPQDIIAHHNWGCTLSILNRRAEAIEHYRRAVEIQPNYAPSYYRLAKDLYAMGRPAEAIERGLQAVRLLPNEVEMVQFVASLLALHEGSEGGDPEKAIQLAQHVCRLTNHRDAACLDTLAAAYASAGRFDDAVTTAKEAWQMVQAAGQGSLAEEIHIRLQLYRDRKPYRIKREHPPVESR
jgi:tetratricopeptide (TPR) repeat protein